MCPDRRLFIITIMFGDKLFPATIDIYHLIKWQSNGEAYCSGMTLLSCGFAQNVEPQPR